MGLHETDPQIPTRMANRVGVLRKETGGGGEITFEVVFSDGRLE
jgi:hypothetical protein